MTPDEIRSLYVETLARAEYAQDREYGALEPGASPWEQADGQVRDYYRRTCVGFLVDALAEAGLLPTQVEEIGAIPVYSDEETIAYWKPGSRRYMTDRREVTE